MELKNGSRLGHYEISGRLGAGGMGEVYRAVDKRLERVVAIKVLPAHLSERADLRQRIEREARTISSLNHPNICTLFDVGEQDGSTFLVMELVEGEPLSDKLTKGPLSVQQTVKYAIEIAEALDRAHSQNIVHRDLKPANVMIGKSGVKLLDFGLAKLNVATVFGHDAPTIQRGNDPLTAEGSIIGTLQYMAPEQLEGKEADTRTDIFALGVTMYEMLTGKRPFDGSSQASIIANILHQEPRAIAGLQPGVPATLARLVTVALNKDPEQRWQTARDIALQLRGFDLLSSSELASSDIGSVRRVRGRRWVWPLLAACIAALAIVVGFFAGRKMVAPTESFSRFSVAPPGGLHYLVASDAASLAVSRDGQKIVFGAQEGTGESLLYLRESNSFEAKPLPGTEGATSAFFSPDGESVAFFSRGALVRLRLADGSVRRLCYTGPGYRGGWSEDGTVYFNAPSSLSVQSVAETGGVPRVVTTLAAGEASHSLAHYIDPAGVLLYTAEREGSTFDEADIIAYHPASKLRKVLLRGSSPRYSAKAGQLLFARDKKLWSIAFDPKALTTSGAARVVAEPLLIYPASGSAAFDVDALGDIFLIPTDDRVVANRLLSIDRAGRSTPLPFEPRPWESPTLTADGKKLSLELLGANNDVWIADLERNTISRLTSKRENLAPIITPDGKHVIASSPEDALKVPMRIISTEDGDDAKELLPLGLTRFPSSLSADGKLLAFLEFGQDTAGDILLLHRNPPHEVVTLVKSRFNEIQPALSPDGEWVAYTSNETGTAEVYLRATRTSGGRVRVSSNGGNQPLWANSGKELFFRDGDEIMSVAITFTPTLVVGAPTRLFTARMPMDREISRSYAVAPDDSRFIVLERSTLSESITRIDVIRGALGH